MAPPRVQIEINLVPNVHFHVKLVTCSLVQKSVGVEQITNGQDHVTHHVILFDVDVWMLLSMVLSIAKIQISLVPNVNSHVLEVTVLKVLNLEHVLSGKVQNIRFQTFLTFFANSSAHTTRRSPKFSSQG